MRSRQPSLREEWRDVRGWIPWLVAGVYFPLYVVLDYVAGGTLARSVWLPRSVSVALCSLAIALLVAGALIVRRLDGVSPSTVLEEVDPRSRARSGGRSTVGSSGGVNRRTVETDVQEASAGGAEQKTASPDRQGSSGAADADEEGWPDEWISGDKI